MLHLLLPIRKSSEPENDSEKGSTQVLFDGSLRCRPVTRTLDFVAWGCWVFEAVC